jgi:signal transduction histidine kinase
MTPPFDIATDIRLYEWQPWLRLLTTLEPYREWGAFREALGRELEMLTGAQGIALCLRGPDLQLLTEPLLGTPLPPPSVDDLPQALGRVHTRRETTSAMVYSAEDLAIWLVLVDAGRWNLTSVLQLVAAHIGQIAARVWRFHQLRQGLSRSIAAEDVSLPGNRRQELTSILAAAARAADGVPVFVIQEGDEFQAAWRSPDETLQIAAIDAGRLLARFRAGLAGNEGTFLYGSHAQALADLLGRSGELESFYFVRLRAVEWLRGLLGLGLPPTLGALGPAAVIGGEDVPASRPLSTARWRQVRAIEQLRVLTTEFGKHLRHVGVREQAYAEGIVHERRLLGIELHDSVLQDLSYVQLQLGRLEQVLTRDEESASRILGQVRSVLATSSRETRDLASGLSASDVSDDVVFVLERVIGRFQSRFDGQVDFRVEGFRTPVLMTVNGQLQRICQEVLNNVEKHAAATHVRVDLHFGEDELRLTIADNGRGFVLDEAGLSQLGLRGVRQRAKWINADISIDSKVGEGTMVTLRVPL